jgi:heat shock protein HslJ
VLAWDEQGSFAAGELAQTEMACEPAEVMDLEHAFLAFLATVDEFAVDDDRLTLQGAGDTWIFEALPPIPTADLVGATWQLDGYVANDAVSNEAGMDAATLTLHPDGTLSGSTNCRELTGTWIESGAEILLTELSAEGECPDEAASDLDGRILEVLGDGFAVDVDGQRLTITSQGGVGLTFTAG